MKKAKASRGRGRPVIIVLSEEDKAYIRECFEIKYNKLYWKSRPESHFDSKHLYSSHQRIRAGNLVANPERVNQSRCQLKVNGRVLDKSIYFFMEAIDGKTKEQRGGFGFKELTEVMNRNLTKWMVPVC
jgi:hypothetical protein